MERSKRARDLRGLISGSSYRQITRTYCRVCERRTLHTLRGVQKDQEGKPLFAYYDCTICNNTQAFPPKLAREGG